MILCELDCTIKTKDGVSPQEIYEVFDEPLC